ncbi:DNA sulfur modification protein DndB [Paenibacillus soyae]|uniref:DGQHR domain-containing protein n=1 Tax=Paenibacillus soyae TaxID=2969249 RepID=A0A9X2S9Q2_9BACL|nr:DNA sulfur modification protein DndB [Paenibacillus soyae]MCR2805386.1 DGQHR domain-containing protein [Paenibacillus soyae]
MAVVLPCIKGKMGSTTFYQTKMSALELVKSVRAASELDEWTSMGPEERIQREPNKQRIVKEIAPYITDSSDRFFGSLIVLVYRGEIDFEGIHQFVAKVPKAYQSTTKDMGFLTIDGATLIVLDGQHRYLALDKVVNHEVQGEFSKEVPHDELSVIFIPYESNEKTRRIFNKINKYAKATGRGDNILTDEDNTMSILARRFILDGEPLSSTYRADNGRIESVVNFKNNTLSARSLQFTTISTIHETVKMILEHKDIEVNPHLRPTDDELSDMYSVVKEYWEAALQYIEVYDKALENNKLIPKFRDPNSQWSLLFKPAAQLALFKGVIMAEKYGAPLKDVLQRVNKVNWSMNNPIWVDINVRTSGTIDPKLEAQNKAAHLICYLLASAFMDKDSILAVKKMYNSARKNDNEDLPPPIL